MVRVASFKRTAIATSWASESRPSSSTCASPATPSLPRRRGSRTAAFLSANDMLLVLAASLLRLRRLCKRRCVRPRAARNGSQTPPASRNSVVVRPPRPPSPLGPRGGRGPGRGARGPFANQKNRRAQNDLGRRPSTPQKRGAVDQGHSAATERTQALDDEPRRPARTRCSAARRSFKGQFDSQHRRRYRASRVPEPRPAPPPRAAARERLVTRAPAPRRRRASREGRRRRANLE